MHIDRPDPRFTEGKRASSNFRLALKLALVATGLLWFVLLADAMLGLDLLRYGLRPRYVPGLKGVLTAPLLHADAEHLFSNTFPLIVALTAMLYLYPNSAVRVIPLVWVGSGLIAWIIGRPSLHIGASGLIYGLLAYIFVGGLLRRDTRSMAVSFIVWFLYGSMVWGVMPVRENMSWEMHLSGALMGIALAIWYRSWDRPPMVKYAWEDDDTDEVPAWFPDEGLPPEGHTVDHGAAEPLHEWDPDDGADWDEEFDEDDEPPPPAKRPRRYH